EPRGAFDEREAKLSKQDSRSFDNSVRPAKARRGGQSTQTLSTPVCLLRKSAKRNTVTPRYAQRAGENGELEKNARAALPKSEKPYESDPLSSKGYGKSISI